MGILRGLTSRILACGCVAGLYETYRGEIVAILDVRSATCSDESHQSGNEIPITSDRSSRPYQPNLS